MLAEAAPTDLLWDVLLKTALVLAVLYAVLWAIRRFMGRGVVAPRGTSILVIHSAHLGPGRSVHLIGVGDKMLLVGATSQQVSLLAELDVAGEVAPPDAPVEAASFERYLHRAAEMWQTASSRLRIRGGDGGENRPGSGAAK